MPETRLVAYLDLLGFSARVLQEGLEEFIPRYSAAVERAFAGVDPGDVGYEVFSDSFVIYTASDDTENLFRITKRCSRLLYEMLNLELPVRGCIGVGKLDLIDLDHGVIVAGPPMVEAFGIEQRQRWAGVILAPSVIRRYPQLTRRRWIFPDEMSIAYVEGRSEVEGQALLHRDVVPFRSADGALGELVALGVLPSTSDEVTIRDTKMAIGTVQAKINMLRLMAPDPETQALYAATYQFLRAAARSCAETARAFPEHAP